MAVNIPLQRKRKRDDSIVKSIITTKVKLDPQKVFFSKHSQWNHQKCSKAPGFSRDINERAKNWRNMYITS